MKNVRFFIIFAALILCGDFLLVNHLSMREEAAKQDRALARLVVRELGCSDLAVATEARYTRHPAVSDKVVPFMDHPGDIEHFPTGSFWQPVP